MSKTNPIFLLIHCLVLFLFLNYANSQSHDEEQTILLRLKQHWQDPTSLEQWKQSNSSHCAWPGVTCTNNTITQLLLEEKNITGTIPPFISDLKNLAVLNFSNNSIFGNFPVAVLNISKLEVLDLSQNYFVGAIPHDIDRLARLTYLNLCANNFSGNIPPSVGRLPVLRTLQLNDNLFDSTFPPELGNLSNLEGLYMAHNGFLPSRLPSNFTKLKKLKELWISGANLIGGIPEMIGEMVDLEFLDLSSNELTGNLPGSLFMLKKLSVLLLYKNVLSGKIPPVVQAFDLMFIDLSENNLTGTIPVDFGKLDKLSGLNLQFNQLSGEIPESIGSLPALKDLRLFSNNLSGKLPPDLGRYSTLESFQVASNRLTGNLPEYLCHGGELVGLVAFDNKLNGELPESLGNCSSLSTVIISNNEFSGNIPLGLWNAFSLSSLMVNENFFTGELPNEVSKNLLRLEISNNRFSGELPFGGDSWRNLVVFNASNNLFAGNISREFTALPSLTTILLDKNRLTGALPSDIISWKSLTTLNLSQNQLSGQIPEEIGSLPRLLELDLSDNQFSGEIPPQLGLLRLTFLNLSSNHLTGQIPSQYENGAYASSFLNNPGLCARSSFLYLNVCNFRPQKTNNISTEFLALMLSALIAVFLFALLVSFVMIRGQRKRNLPLLDSRWKFSSFQRLNFTESDILPGLSESNLIGSGGSGKVYRVTVNGSNDVVAVKRIWNNQNLDQRLEREFNAEVEMLSAIKHLNIVKLLCCISNNNSKLLVYEYLENRSLDRWLHTGKTSKTTSGSTIDVVLDWPKRLWIAVGAAQGLCYMHDDCSPPIVHRDIKSSNILLDSEFNAKIADFGLAKLLINQGELATVSAVAGSFGYIAPEYAQAVRVNEKTDVYSFGVVLLELTTGKAANYGDENTCLAKWAWRHMHEGKPVADALDEEIKETRYLDEMSHVFQLGVFCTSTLPSARPNMREVLRILLGRSHSLVHGRKKMENEHDASPLLKNLKRERLSERDGSLASIV